MRIVDHNHVDQSSNLKCGQQKVLLLIEELLEIEIECDQPSSHVSQKPHFHNSQDSKTHPKTAINFQK